MSRATPIAILLCGLGAANLACAIPHTMTTSPAGRECPSDALAGRAEGSTIDWISPDRDRDERKLEEWCRTVGPAVVDSLPAIRYRSAEPSGLAVVTWNAHGLAGDIEGLLHTELNFTCPSPGSGIPPTRDIEMHFVLLLQEVVRRSDAVPEVERSDRIPNRLGGQPDAGESSAAADDPVSDIAEVAGRCGLAMVYVPSMRNGADTHAGGREDRGNAILSTLPLHDLIAIELPFEVQRRIAMAATVRPNSGDSLRVVSLHLDTMSGFLRTLRTGNSNRLRQGLGLVEALELAEAAHMVTPDSVPPGFHIATAVAGDLNTFSDHQTVIRHLAEHFPDSPPPDGLPTKGVFPADHILFRAGRDGRWSVVEGSYRRLDDLYYSDHYARLILLSMRSEGS
jgi:endonuclease/exonuclease/phosphatase family metal-dependent hydrolase